jgi:hypothetical protein
MFHIKAIFHMLAIYASPISSKTVGLMLLQNSDKKILIMEEKGVTYSQVALSHTILVLNQQEVSQLYALINLAKT